MTGTTQASSGMGADIDDLVPMLADYLPHQRWFSAKGQDLGDIVVTGRTAIAYDLDGADVEQVLFTVQTATGTQRYQIWIGWNRHLPDRLTHAVIGVAAGLTAYDALQDTSVSAFVLSAIDENRDFATGDATLRARREPDAELDTTAEGLVIGAEQSNTSIVYGHSTILKVYRRLEPGPNPDAEIHRALHAVGSQHIAQPLGEITGPVDGEETTLALLTEFFANSAEGWAMATASVRDLMSEGDLRADEVGGDFAAESYRLGQAVAAVHADLAQAFGTTVAPHDELRRILGRMATDAETAIGLVPDLAEYREPILTAFERAGSDAGGLNLQRIHGDLHLGQVLRTLTGWSIIDFEGEPAKPLAYRREMHSPLRDVAGMLRSYDYAARGLVLNPQQTDAQHRYRAAEWATRNRKAFTDGYAAAAGNDPRRAGSLLRAFELDKAIYEVVYEHGHRPTWMVIPMQAITNLI